jgi:Uma2 family endonuclease
MAMSMISGSSSEHVVYPDSDGEPMGESVLQAEIIVMLKIGFQHLFAGRPDVLVGADNFWYPVEGDPKTVIAPDTMVIVGLDPRPDIRAMGSYRPFEHGGRVMLAIEVLSPSNTWAEMLRKREFYERFGVEEYWVFDPQTGALEVWARMGDGLRPLPVPVGGLVSPTTGVRVESVDGDLVVHDPDGGHRWLWSEGVAAQAGRAVREAARADQEAARADEEAARAEREAARAEAAERRIRELEGAMASARDEPGPS